MKKIVLIIGFIIVAILTYLVFNMYPFAKGVINDIPKNETKKDIPKIQKIITETKNKPLEKETQYPKWLIDNYSKESQTDRHLTTDIIEVKKLNDSISIVLYEQNSGVCNFKNIDTYKNEEKISKLELETRCDMDLSRSHFSWKSYQLKNGKYYLTEFEESANDTLIDTDGFLKIGYSFDEIETKIDSVIKVFQIDNNGKIIEFIADNDCVFDQSTQTDEFLKDIPEFSNYKWNDKLKTATIELESGDTLIVKKGGCDHYGFYGNLILENSNLDINQNEIINRKALWIAKKLFEKSDFDFFKKSIDEKKYEIIKENKQIYITFEQEMWCNATLVIKKNINSKISIEIGYYIC